MQSTSSPESRIIWSDYRKGQEFEHELINRKATWLLTTQGLLFAAYGVTFKEASADAALLGFRQVVIGTGVAIALIDLVGVGTLIAAKFLHWRKYRALFITSEKLTLPEPLNERPLQWGMQSVLTAISLVPDVLFPMAFAIAWWAVPG
jgi:hypothetical protein